MAYITHVVVTIRTYSGSKFRIFSSFPFYSRFPFLTPMGVVTRQHYPLPKNPPPLSTASGNITAEKKTHFFHFIHPSTCTRTTGIGAVLCYFMYVWNCTTFSGILPFIFGQDMQKCHLESISQVSRTRVARVGRAYENNMYFASTVQSTVRDVL